MQFVVELTRTACCTVAPSSKGILSGASHLATPTNLVSCSPFSPLNSISTTLPLLHIARSCAYDRRSCRHDENTINLPQTVHAAAAQSGSWRFSGTDWQHRVIAEPSNVLLSLVLLPVDDCPMMIFYKASARLLFCSLSHHSRNPPDDLTGCAAITQGLGACSATDWRQFI